VSDKIPILRETSLVIVDPQVRYVGTLGGKVSTQGRGDEAALQAALAVEADYVAFVGSRRQAETLEAKLASRGIASERLARLRAPAGLDFGAIAPDEIAVSILAEIVAARRGGHPRWAATA